MKLVNISDVVFGSTMYTARKLASLGKKCCGYMGYEITHDYKTIISLFLIPIVFMMSPWKWFIIYTLYTIMSLCLIGYVESVYPMIQAIFISREIFSMRYNIKYKRKDRVFFVESQTGERIYIPRHIPICQINNFIDKKIEKEKIKC